MARQLLERIPPIEYPLYWNAYWALSTERLSGMSLGSIPVSKVRWYAEDVLLLDCFEVEAFEQVIMAVDNAYLALVNKRNKSR